MFTVGSEHVVTVIGVTNGGGVDVTAANGQRGLLRLGTLKEHHVYPQHETEDTLTVLHIQNYIKPYDIVRVRVLSVRVQGLPEGIADLEFIGWF